jgi:hypothetical protein
MKNSIFIILLGVCSLITGLYGQGKVLTADDFTHNGDILIYTTDKADFYGVRSNGRIASVYQKNKKTGKTAEVVFNGTTKSGDMREADSDNKESNSTTVMAKVNDGASAPATTCKGYQKYDCEVIVGRDPATGTTITKKGECLREIKVACPNNPTRKANQQIKATGTTNQVKSNQ